MYPLPVGYNMQQMSSADFKADLQGLHISAAKEVDVTGGRKAIIIFVPYKQLKDYHKIQPKLVRELEKKFRYWLRSISFILIDKAIWYVVVSMLWSSASVLFLLLLPSDLARFLVPAQELEPWQLSTKLF